MLGHLHKVFPGVGIVPPLPQNRGNVLGYVAGETAQAVTLDEGHHVVFKREQIICTHSQALIFADAGGLGSKNVES